MDALYQQVVAGKQKAIAGFVVTFLATYVAQYGFNIQTLTLGQVVEQLVYAMIGYGSVYLKKNQ